MSASGSISKFLWKNKGTAFNTAIGGYGALSTYQEQREQGSGVAASAAAAAMEFSLPMMMSTKAYLGLQLLSGAPEMAFDAYNSMSKYRRQLTRESTGQAFLNARFDDTQQAYTMRQAGMAIAQRSRYNTQQARLGNEAKYMMK